MVDPVSKLPSETQSQIFALLNTAALTRSERVSKAWKGRLQDPFLHRILDLILEKNNRPTRQYLSGPEIQRLLLHFFWSDRSIKELYLDVSWYWQEVLSDYSYAVSARQGMVSPLRINLQQIAFGGKLPERIHFEVQDEMWESYEDKLHISEHFIQLVLDLATSYPVLRDISLEIPFPLCLVQEGLDPKDGQRRRLALNENFKNNAYDGYRIIIDQVTSIITKLPQIGFTKVGICSASLQNEPMGPFEKAGFSFLLTQIAPQASTIKDLHLEIDVNLKPSQAWNLVLQCPKLSKLLVSFYDPSESKREFKREIIHLPKDVTFNSRFKSLEIGLDGVEWDWNLEADQILEWIGTGLEELIIKAPRDELQISNGLLFSILNRNPSLTKVILDEPVRPQDDQDQVFTEPTNQLELPNLKILELSPRMMKRRLFKTAKVPNLKQFSVSKKKKGKQEEESTLGYMDPLNLSDQCIPLLTTLKPQAFTSEEKCLERKLALWNFEWLETLDLSSDSEVTEHWRHLSAPNLKHLHLSPTTSCAQDIGRIMTPSISSLETITSGIFWHWQGPNRELDLATCSANLNIPESPAFANLEELHLDGTMIFLVKLFGQASFGKLKKLSISFDGQLVDQLGIKEAETAQDLVSILQSSCSSLVELNLNTLRRGGGEMFAVGEGSLNKFWQAEPLVFPYLDRVNVNNRAVNHYLERSHTPMKGHSRNEMIKKRSQEK